MIIPHIPKSLCAFKKGKQLLGNNFLGCLYKLFKLFPNKEENLLSYKNFANERGGLANKKAKSGVSADDVIADGVVVLRKTKGHNTVLTAQAPPRGASAHARYLAASKISARQDGRTVLVMRRVFAVSPRSALSHSNLATCFRGKFRNEFLRCSMLNFGRFDTKPR